MADVLEYCVVLIFLSLMGPFLWKRFRNRKRRQNTKNAVLIFSRYPKAGTTKTRLIPSIGKEGAAFCQLLMTEHLLDKLSETSTTNSENIEIELQCNGGNADEMDYWLERRAKSELIDWTPQTDGNLGNKLRYAIRRKFNQGKENVVVVGSDIPGITALEIDEAFCKLQAECDMVLGKAKDGGYYLVGFNRRALRYLDKIFNEIEWGTEVVFEQQMAKAKEMEANIGVLSRELSDIDNAEDLDVFQTEVGVSKGDLTVLKWSVIIPTFNESNNIIQTIESVIKNASDVNALADIVISDGGSTDMTVQTVKAYSETCPVSVKVIISPPGRGFQLKSGAGVASGNYFFFLHADTIPPHKFDVIASRILRKPGNSAGSFRFGFDIFHGGQNCPKESWWFRMVLQIISYSVGLRTRYMELPYGDQGLFVSKTNYNNVGGYDEVYLMEDVMLVEKLMNKGHVVTDEGSPILTSSRRWKKMGALKATSLNFLIISLYKLGVPPNTLAQWYYGDKLKFVKKS